MLIIGKGQFEALGATNAEVMMKRLEKHIRMYFGDGVEDLSEEEIQDLLKRNWKRANGYGLKTELGVCAFLNAVCALGEDFTADCAWASPLLEDQQLSEDLKRDDLERQVRIELSAC
ncbi:hypothetical protein OVA24_04655 [Luteolibacter sp. SL250]|uniref:hypothetical protein n=1 Tax=Luteolibacter sp. SL250 TaxID=2995170 RepID=UPI00226F6231|nr:hypothetical protein [Luteolibacter sp. SL250]WAC20669.1 hypothetical protein OVA24_04655 [Luteolibacter sp. SL250]